LYVVYFLALFKKKTKKNHLWKGEKLCPPTKPTLASSSLCASNVFPLI
jgi:hypothetical protein